MEKDTRSELYLNLLGKSQSFHDEQRLGDILARATNDVRQLNFLIFLHPKYISVSLFKKKRLLKN